MRKGSYAPRVRARWVKSQFERTQQQWCTWLDPLFAGLYVFNIGPVVVPVSLVYTDMSPGKWMYCPGTGAIRWLGEFDCISVWGNWAVEVKADYDKISQYRFGLSSTDASLNAISFMTDWTTDTRSDFVSPTTLAIDNGQSAFNPGIPAWAFVNCPGSVGLKYVQIEMAGADRENTAPLTWAAADDPW